MREFFIKKLILSAKINKKIVLVVNDVGYGYVEKFQKKFPDRFFNAGVSEQNMMGFAAGLAYEGFKVFVYGIGNFVTTRCFEQIRNDVDYHNLDVNIVSIGSGLSYGSAGYTHHLIQDYAIIRSLNNFTINSPSNLSELDYCLKKIIKSKNPSYLRIGAKQINKKLFQTKNINFHIKKKNKDLIIFTSDIKDFICENILSTKKNYNLISVPIWGKNIDFVIKFIQYYKNIIIVEDHVKDGGFYSWILENMNYKILKNTKFLSYSLSKKVINKVGDRNFLMKKYLIKN